MLKGKGAKERNKKKDPNNRDCWQKVRMEKKNPLNLIDDQETENSNHSEILLFHPPDK